MRVLGKIQGRFCQIAAAVLLLGLSVNADWASNVEPLKPCTRGNTSQDRLSVHSSETSGTNPAKEHLTSAAGAGGFCPRQFTQDFFSDQKAIWTSPWHLHTQDKRWLAPLAVGTLVLVASDQAIMRHFGTTPLTHSSSFSNYGLATLAGSAASLYLRGAMTKTKDDHSRETGFLAGEAALNSVIVAETMKLAFQRPRPNAANAGSFGAGGASFPSEHALAAWSIASVIAHEYPGPMTRLLVYGAAMGITLSRVAAREHFPSDVFVGSAVGYLMGRYVYRAHHDSRLPGSSASAFEETFTEEPITHARKPDALGSPYVPLDSWVYAAFDRLAALGYAPSAYANLRPWTRMECARLLAAADDDLGADFGAASGAAPGADSGTNSSSTIGTKPGAKQGRMLGNENENENVQPSEAYPLYAALRAEFASDLARFDGSGSSTVGVDSIYARYLGIAGTPLDDGYHFGQTLLDDDGRPYGRGSNMVSGVSASGSAGPVAFYVRAEYQHAAALPAYSQSVQQMIGAVDVTPPQDPIHTAIVDRFRLLDAYAVWNFKTIQISAGRQSLWWGPGRGGPSNFSDNAEPMDMVRLTNPSPWRLPGFFHWLGPMRWEFFVGVMAGHHYPANPGIDGQKVSFKPTPNLEFGFSRTIVFHPVTLHMFWRGISSFGDNKTTIPGSTADVGDRRGGFDFSYRIPGLRKWLVLYNDGMTDDDTSPLGAPQRALMNPGIYLPRIPHVPKLDWRAEMVWSDPPALSNRGGKFNYYNGAYHDSYTNDGHLLGSWVGREGHGLQLWSTYWLSPRNSVQVGYRKAHVDRDFIPAGGNIQDFLVRGTFQFRGLEITTFLQYEGWNFPVLAPLAGPNTLASVEFTYHPKWRKVLNFQ
jgi:membrane-associated phospholipid phosphatase